MSWIYTYLVIYQVCQVLKISKLKAHILNLQYLTSGFQTLRLLVQHFVCVCIFLSFFSHFKTFYRGPPVNYAMVITVGGPVD